MATPSAHIGLAPVTPGTPPPAADGSEATIGLTPLDHRVDAAARPTAGTPPAAATGKIDKVRFKFLGKDVDYSVRYRRENAMLDPEVLIKLSLQAKNALQTAYGKNRLQMQYLQSTPAAGVVKLSSAQKRGLARAILITTAFENLDTYSFKSRNGHNLLTINYTDPHTNQAKNVTIKLEEGLIAPSIETLKDALNDQIHNLKSQEGRSDAQNALLHRLQHIQNRIKNGSDFQVIANPTADPLNPQFTLHYKNSAGQAKQIDLSGDGEEDVWKKIANYTQTFRLIHDTCFDHIETNEDFAKKSEFILDQRRNNHYEAMESERAAPNTSQQALQDMLRQQQNMRQG